MEKVNDMQQWRVQAGDRYNLASIIEHEVKQKKLKGLLLNLVTQAAT